MKTTQALATAATLATASAYGSLAIVNYCTSPIYLWPVAGGEAAGQMITLPASDPTKGYKEEFRSTNNGGGISIKMAPNYYPNGGIPRKVVQMEYTIPQAGAWDDLIFYDLSYVDANPLDGWGITMQTSTGQSGTPCPHGTCMPGHACDIAYNFWNDDTKTHACGIENDIIISLCSNAGGDLAVPKGLIQWNSKREAEAEAKAAPAPEADPLAVCVGLNGGLAGLCDNPAPAAKVAEPATTTSSTTEAAKPTPAPVVAVQQAPKAAAPASSPAAAAVNPVQQVSNLVPQAVSLQALTNIGSTPVTTWYSWNNYPSKRDIKEKREAHIHAHQHNHADFHRRNRIIKASA